MRYFIAVWLVLVSFGLMISSDAYAKRFGGGRSFGTYRAVNSFSRMPPTATAFQSAATRNGSRWLGPLAGLAAGGLLASLFMGNGFASGMMSWLLVAGIAMLLINFARRFSHNKMRPVSPQHNMYNMHREENVAHAITPSYRFNEAEFLRYAKVQFIRLQAAYDKKNLQDIGQFTTPEIFAEIRLQLQERGDKDNQTDVVTLEANLLNVSTEYQGAIASVEFSGLIKEEPHGNAVALNEIWHFHKGANSENWLISGIQQLKEE